MSKGSFDYRDIDNGFQVGTLGGETGGGGDFKWTINTAPLKKLPEEVRKALIKLCDEVTFSIEHDAKALCPVDTGALQAGLYGMTARQNDAWEAVSAARRLNPTGDMQEILEAPESEFVGKIGSVMAYWEDVEYGLGYGPAHPFIEPAFRMNAAKLRNGISHAFDQAAANSGMQTNITPNATWSAKFAASSDMGFIGD